MDFPILYKKTSTGKLQTWRVWTDQNSYFTETGQLDGKKTTSAPTVCLPKNEGKSNATNPVEQAQKEAYALWEGKMKDGYVEGMQSALDGLVDAKYVAGGLEPMLAKSYDDAFKHIKFPCFVQPKLDGIRAIFHKGCLYSRKRKKINSSEHIIQALRNLGLDHMTLDGELYNHDFKDDFEKISSAVRREDSESPYRKDVQFHIYDVIAQIPFTERAKLLRNIEDEILVHGNIKELPVRTVLTLYAENHEHVESFHEEFTGSGFEGVMLRNVHGPYEFKRSFHLQKFKKFKDKEFKVIGVEEGSGKFAGLAAKFICEMDDAPYRTFKATPEGTLETKRDYLVNFEKYRGKPLTVKFLNYTTKNRVPRHGTGLRFRDVNF